VAEDLYRVELTASFLERLDAIEAFLVTEADAGFAFDTCWPSCAPPSSPTCGASRASAGATWQPAAVAEALAQLAALPAGAPDALREYLHGDYLMLYTGTRPMATASSRSTTPPAPSARWIAMPRLMNCLPAFQPPPICPKTPLRMCWSRST
jgi:hypothetical protein